MKLESKSKQFQPVVITIESEDELRTLWHALNVSSREWSGDLCKPKSNRHLNMWSLVDGEVNKRGLKND